MMRNKVVISVVGLIVLGAGIFTMIVLTKESNPIPESIRTSTNFPLYYPAKLPQNWQIQQSSFSKSTDVVLYRISDNTDAQKNISISIQPQPKAFNFDKFYKETLAKSTQFTTDLGLAAIGEGESGYKIGSIATGDSWVLITSNAKNVDNGDIRTILDSLKN